MGSEVFKLKSLYLEDTVVRGARVSFKNAPSTKTLVVNNGDDSLIKTGEAGINREYVIEASLVGNDLKGYGTVTNNSDVYRGYSGPQEVNNGDLFRFGTDQTFYGVTGIQGTDIYLTDKYTKESTTTPDVQTGVCVLRKVKINSVKYEAVTNDENQNYITYDKNKASWGITGIQPSGPYIMGVTGAHVDYALDAKLMPGVKKDLVTIGTVYKTLVNNNTSPITDLSLSPLPYPHSSLQVFYAPAGGEMTKQTEYENYVVNYSQNPELQFPYPPYEERSVAYIKFLDKLVDEVQVTSIGSGFNGQVQLVKRSSQPGNLNLTTSVQDIMPSEGFSIKVGGVEGTENSGYIPNYSAGLVTFVRHQNEEQAVDSITYPKNIIWDGLSVIKGVGETGVSNFSNLVIPGIKGIAGTTGTVYFEDTDANNLIRGTDFQVDFQTGAITLTQPLKETDTVLISYYVEGIDVEDERIDLAKMRTVEYPIVASSMTLTQYYDTEGSDGKVVSNKRTLVEDTDYVISYVTGRINLIRNVSGETTTKLQATYTPMAQVNCVLQSVQGQPYSFRMTIVDDVLAIKDKDALLFGVNNPVVSVPKKDPFKDSSDPTKYSFNGTVIPDSLLSVKDVSLGIDFSVVGFAYNDQTKQIKLDTSLTDKRPGLDDLVTATYSFESDTLPYAPLLIFFPVLSEGENTFVIEGFDRTDVLYPESVIRITNFNPEAIYYFKIRSVTYALGNTNIELYDTFPQDIQNPTFELVDKPVIWQNLPTGTTIDTGVAVGSEAIILQNNVLKLGKDIKANTLLLINGTQIYEVQSTATAGLNFVVQLFPALRSPIGSVMHSLRPIYDQGATQIVPDYVPITDTPEPAFKLSYSAPVGFEGSAKVLVDNEKIVLYETIGGIQNPVPYQFKIVDYPVVYGLAKAIMGTASTYKVNVPGSKVPDYNPFTIVPDGLKEDYYLSAGVYRSDLLVPFENALPINLPYTFSISTELRKYTLIQLMKGLTYFDVYDADKTSYFTQGNVVAFQSKYTGKIEYHEVLKSAIMKDSVDSSISDTRVTFKDTIKANDIDPYLLKVDSVEWLSCKYNILGIDYENAALTFNGSPTYALRNGQLFKINDQFIYKVTDVLIETGTFKVTFDSAIDPAVKSQNYLGYIKHSVTPVLGFETGDQPYIWLKYTAPKLHTGSAVVVIEDTKLTLTETIDNFTHKPSVFNFSAYTKIDDLLTAIKAVSSIVTGEKPFDAGASSKDLLMVDYRLTPTVGLTLDTVIYLAPAAFSVTYALSGPYTGKAEIKISSTIVELKETVKFHSDSHTEVRTTVLYLPDYVDMRGLVTEGILKTPSLVSSSILPYSSTFLNTDFFNTGTWGTVTLVAPFAYTQMSATVYGSLKQVYFGLVGILNEKRLIPDSAYTLDSGVITLATPMKALDRFKFSYMGLDSLAEDEGKSITCSCRFFKTLAAGSRVDVYFDYLNIDQFYLQKLTERKFSEIVVVPQIQDILNQKASGGGFGSDSGATDAGVPNWSGGSVNDYYYLRDELIKKQLYLRFFQWYKSRLRDFAAELQLILGFRFAHSNAIGLNNGSYTLDDAHVEDQNYTLTKTTDFAQAMNGFNKFFPIGYDGTAPQYYNRFGTEYLSFNEVYCCNVKYVKDGTLTTVGVVKSEQPYWKRAVDLDYVVWQDKYINQNLVGAYEVPVPSVDRTFSSSSEAYSFLKVIDVGDSVKIDSFNDYYTISDIVSPEVKSDFTVDVASGSITVSQFDWQVNDTVRFTTTGTLPKPLGSGIDYYIKSVTVSNRVYTIQISTSVGGDILKIVNSGTGTHTVHDIKTYEYMILSKPFTEKGIQLYDLTQIAQTDSNKNPSSIPFDNLIQRLPPDGYRINIKRVSAESFPMCNDNGSLGADVYGGTINGLIKNTRKIKKPFMADFMKLLFPLANFTDTDPAKKFRVMVKKDPEASWETVGTIDMSKLTFKEERNLDDVMDALRFDFTEIFRVPAFPPLFPKDIPFYDIKEKDTQGLYRYFYISVERVYDAGSKNGYYDCVAFRAKNRNWWFRVEDAGEQDIVEDYGLKDYQKDTTAVYENFYDPNNIYRALLKEKQAWETESYILKDLYDFNDKLARAFYQGNLNQMNTLYQGYLAKPYGGSTNGITDILMGLIPAYESYLLFLLNSEGPLNGIISPDHVHNEDSASPAIATSYKQAQTALTYYQNFYNLEKFYENLNNDNNNVWRNDYIRWCLSLQQGVIYQKVARSMYESQSNTLTVGMAQYPAIGLMLFLNGTYDLTDAFCAIGSDYYGKYLRITAKISGVSETFIFKLYKSVVVDTVTSIVYRMIDDVVAEINAYKFNGATRVFQATNVFKYQENNVLPNAVIDYPLNLDYLTEEYVNVSNVVDHRQSDPRVLFLDKNIEDRVYTSIIRNQPAFTLKYNGDYYTQALDAPAINITAQISYAGGYEAPTTPGFTNLSYGIFLDESFNKIFMMKGTYRGYVPYTVYSTAPTSELTFKIPLYDTTTATYKTLQQLVDVINALKLIDGTLLFTAKVIYAVSPYGALSSSYMAVTNKYVDFSEASGWTADTTVHVNETLDNMEQGVNQGLYRIYYDENFFKKLEIRFTNVVIDGVSVSSAQVFPFNFNKDDGSFRTLDEFAALVNGFIYKEKPLFTVTVNYPDKPNGALSSRYVIADNVERFLGFDEIATVYADIYIQKVEEGTVSSRDTSQSQNAYFAYPFYTDNGNTKKAKIDGIPVSGSWDPTSSEQVLEISCISGVSWELTFKDYVAGDLKSYMGPQAIITAIEQTGIITSAQNEILKQLEDQPAITILKTLELTRKSIYGDKTYSILLRKYPTLNDLAAAITTEIHNGVKDPDLAGLSTDFHATVIGTQEAQGTYKSYELDAQYVPILMDFGVSDKGSVHYYSNRVIGWQVITYKQTPDLSKILTISNKRYSPGSSFKFRVNNPKQAYEDTLNKMPQGFKTDTLAFDVYCWDDADSDGFRRFVVRDNWIYFKSQNVNFSFDTDLGQPDKTLGYGIPLAGSGHHLAADDENIGALVGRINSNAQVNKWFYANLKFTRDIKGTFEYGYLPNYESGLIHKAVLDNFYLRDDKVLTLVPGQGYAFTASAYTVHDTANTIDLSCSWNMSYTYQKTYDLTLPAYDTISELVNALNVDTAPVLTSSVFQAAVVGSHGSDASTTLLPGSAYVTGISEIFVSSVAGSFTVDLLANNLIVSALDWQVNDVVIFTTTVTLPSPLVPATSYYVVAVTVVGGTNYIKVSGSLGGPAIIIANVGSGTHTVQTYRILAALSDWHVNDIVRFTTTAALPLPLTLATDYYVVSVVPMSGGYSLRVSSMFGGTGIHLLSAGAGNNTISRTYKDLMAGTTTSPYSAIQLKIRNSSGTSFTILNSFYRVGRNLLDVRVTIRYDHSFTLIGYNYSAYTLSELATNFSGMRDFISPIFGPIFQSSVISDSFADLSATRLKDATGGITGNTTLDGSLSDVIGMKVLNMNQPGTASVTLNNLTAVTSIASTTALPSDKAIQTWITGTLKGDYTKGLIAQDILPMIVPGVTYGWLAIADTTLTSTNTPEHAYFGILGDIQWVQISDQNLHVQLNYVKQRLGLPWKDSSGIVRPDYYTPEDFNTNNPYAIDFDHFLTWLRTTRYGQIKNSIINESVVQNKYLWIYMKFHKEFGCDQRVVALQKRIASGESDQALIESMST